MSNETTRATTTTTTNAGSGVYRTVRYQTVGHIMRRVVPVLFEEDNLTGVAEAMRHFELQAVPVVDGDNLVGMLHERDVLPLTVSPDSSAMHAHRVAMLAEHTFVARVMRPAGRTASPATPLRAIFSLLDSDTGVLPIVEDGALVGVVTTKELRAVAAHLLDSPGSERPEETLAAPVAHIARVA